MRGLAALLVVLFHINAVINNGKNDPSTFGAFWTRGYSGVDMFFVISGFVMVYVTRNLQNGAKNALSFIYARISRIYPLWWVFASLMMLYFWLSYGQPAAPDKVSGDKILPHILKSLFLLPQYHDPVFGVGWTLIHEMMFYLIFALGLLFDRKFLSTWILVWAGVIVLFGIVGNTLPTHSRSFSQLLVSPMNLEFIFGALAGILFLRFKNVPKPLALSLFIIGIILFLISLTIADPMNKFALNWFRVFVFGLPCAFIVLGASWVEQPNNEVKSSVFVVLGDWSYSIYLSHMLVLLGLRRIWQTNAAETYLPKWLKWGNVGIVDDLIFASIAFVLILLISWISFHFIERPSIRWLRKKY